MTRDDIIRMARDLLEIDDFGAVLTDENILRFAALVAAAEREACARVCDKEQKDSWSPEEAGGAQACAMAIRARGETK